jgi:CBS domain-containing protein
MAQLTVRDVMTPDPRVITRGSSVTEAARIMRDHDIGDVVVVDESSSTVGILTDRDIAVRVIAEDRAPDNVSVESIATGSLVTAEPSTDAQEAARLLREHAVRRLVVLEDDAPVGVVSLGDLAIRLDPDSALADISEAPPPRQ